MEFKNNIMKRIKDHDSSIMQKLRRSSSSSSETPVTMDCLLKNSKNPIEDNAFVMFNTYDAGSESEYSSNPANMGKYFFEGDQEVYIGLTSFDDIFNVDFKWEQLKSGLPFKYNNSIKMVMSKSGWKNVGKQICSTSTTGAGRRRSSRKYKKSNRRIKSSKKRSYTNKYSRTHRYRK
jgi:hypothetical protein